MKLSAVLDQVISQADFAEAIGVSEARVSQLMSERVLTRGETAGQWLLAYCERLRDQAAGRASSETGGLDLVQERAALARSQREAQDLKNATARGEYAPIGLLSDVLGMASSAVVDRFDQLEGALRKACPDLPEEAKSTLMQIVASARNEWIRSTVRLISQSIDALESAGDDDDESSADSLDEFDPQ